MFVVDMLTWNVGSISYSSVHTNRMCHPRRQWWTSLFRTFQTRLDYRLGIGYAKHFVFRCVFASCWCDHSNVDCSAKMTCEHLYERTSLDTKESLHCKYGDWIINIKSASCNCKVAQFRHSNGGIKPSLYIYISFAYSKMMSLMYD